MELLILTPWIGIFTGPVDPDQVHLECIASGCGILPGTDRYMVVPTHMLTVEGDAP